MRSRELKVIGLAKETESPENPGGLDKRVAMIPSDVDSLVKNGCKVYVEKGAGEDIGYTNEEYQKVGAIIQSSDELYQNKDMILKFKGPSLKNIEKMKSGTVLFCMAHFRSFPERAKLLEDCRINVIAMEEILESPKFISDEIVLSKRFAEEKLRIQTIPYGELNIGFLGYHCSMIGAIRRVGNRGPKTHTLYQKDANFEELISTDKNALFFYDSRVFTNKALISKLESCPCKIYDLKEFEKTRGTAAIEEYRKTHPPFEFGGRRIQCLHETGMAGARYGFRLLQENDPSNYNSTQIVVSVLGYGNVGMGAIRESYDQGARIIQILGRGHTNSQSIGPFIEKSNLIVNGAEQPPELRGKNFLIKSEYVGKLIKKGSVIIDLVGGSSKNRSPVEDIIECSFLTNPHFSRDGVVFSALWGWPMMGMMKESAITYSSQILDVLIGREKLLKGLDQLAPGVKAALVCGPFEDVK